MSTPPTPPPSAPHRPASVLVAEDDVVSRRLLRGHLERWGHRVTEAVDGAEAWALFQTEPFEVVIADWMMPEVDGLELVRRIRARPPTDSTSRYVYVMMLTAKSQKEDIVRGMDTGADDYLSKPFDRDELRARLQAGLRILDLQSALLTAEKSASLARLAMAVAQQIAGPLGEASALLADLRWDVGHLVDALDPSAVPLMLDDDPDAPPRMAPAPADIPAIRGSAGPRLLAAADLLQRVRDRVRNLREFANIAEMPTRPVDLASAIADVLVIARPDLELRHISLKPLLPLADNCPPVPGNLGKLKRALLHLVTGAADLAPDGTEFSLRTATESAGGGVVLELASPTVHVPAERLPRLFEPFTAHGPSGATSRTGLSLALAQSILREHNATLSAASSASLGTTFSVRFPRG